MSMVIEAGFREDERAVAAQLYWQAFGAKLGKVLGPSSRAIPFLTAVMDPDYAFVARDAGGQLLGMAGFKTPEGGLINGGLRDMARRAAECAGTRPRGGGVPDGRYFVAQAARGKGVGGQLLDAVTARAAELALRVVRLDVIDTNPRAQALYERKGFVAMTRSHTGPLRHIFGFRSALRMERPVVPVQA